MANQITDNRTQLTNANTVTGFTDLGGTASGTQDTEIFIFGTASVGYSTSNTLGGLLYNTGATQDWSNSTVYLWVNCGIVGLLATKANGGMRVRFAGPTATNYFEVRYAGSDIYPVAVSGGWAMFVVDVATARAVAVANGWTGGTPPASTAVQRVGIATITGGTMPRMVDNTWVDAIWVLNNNNPGIIIEGRNGGTTAWDSADIFTQLGLSTGTFIPTTGGAYAVNTPIQIGINDTTVHEFVDTNAIWLWDDQEFIPDGFYKLSAIGDAGAGTTTVTLGTKTGTGNDATGAQGLTIAAASTGARWAMDMDDANLTIIGLYGCSFQHFGTFELDQANLEAVSCLYIDGQKANVANSLQLRNTIVNAATADGVAFMVTDDFGDIINCSFNFSDGHAIELNAATPTSQNNIGNSFAGYTNSVNSTDAAILNSAAGSLTISSSGGSNLQTNSYRNTGGGSVTILNNISVTLTGLKDNTEVAVYNNSTGELIAEAEPATGGSPGNRSFTFSAPAATVVYITVFNLGWTLPPNNRISNFAVPASDTSIPINQVVDRNYLNP